MSEFWERLPIAQRLLVSYVGLLLLGLGLVAASVAVAAATNMGEINRLDRLGAEYYRTVDRVVVEEREAGRLSPTSAARIDAARDEVQQQITSGLEEVAYAFGAALATGTAIALGVAILLAPRLTRANLRGLRAVAATSRQLAAGDLSARAPVPRTHDEVSHLAHDFNAMAARLEAAFTMQRQFVADAAHELRTPLTALGGQLDVLQRADVSDSVELRGRVRREIDRLSALADDLLSLAVLDARGPASLDVASVNLADVARDVAEQVRAIPAAEGRRLVLDALRPVPVSGDPGRLHQALLNLVSNAVQHTPSGGEVIVRVEETAKGAIVVVRDTGPGIAAEHLPHIFERFYRANDAPAGPESVSTGSGLGLPIAKAVAEAHGGSIGVASSEAGSAFTVRLPLAGVVAP